MVKTRGRYPDKTLYLQVFYAVDIVGHTHLQ